MRVIEQHRRRGVRSLDLRARVVATPAPERAERQRSGPVLGVAAGSAQLAFEPGVVVVTNATRPLMPKGVAIAIDKPDPSLGGVVAPGQRAILEPTGLSAGGLHVHWDKAVAAWEPAITSGRWDRSLCGRVEGLTPVGDDVLAAALVTLAAMAPSVGPSSTKCRRLMSALAAPALAGRPAAASHTLLRLVTQVRTLEPVVRVPDLVSARLAARPSSGCSGSVTAPAARTHIRSASRHGRSPRDRRTRCGASTR
jgi:hypothetical protein